MSLLSDHLVWCDIGCHYVGDEEVVFIGYDIGPDLIEYPVYVCDDCQEEIDAYDDEY